MNRAGLAAYRGLVEEAGTDPCGAVAAAGKRASCPLCHGCLADVFEVVLPAWLGIKTQALLLTPGTPEEPAREPLRPQATTPHNARICVTSATIALEPKAAPNGGDARLGQDKGRSPSVRRSGRVGDTDRRLGARGGGASCGGEGAQISRFGRGRRRRRRY